MIQGDPSTVNSVRLTLPEPPSANRWWRNVNGRMVTSREAREYKDLVARKRWGLGVTFRKPDTVSVTVVWRRSRKAGDLDKRLGVLLDALQGFVYESDSQVVAIHAARYDAATKDAACVEVTIEPIEAGSLLTGDRAKKGETDS